MAGGRTTRHGSLSTDPDEDTKFKLAFVEALSDTQVAAKLTTLMRAANKDLVDQVASLRDEVRGLKTALADRDATIAQLQGEVRGLRLQNDALEQYGRRSSLRITGISEDLEDTTAAVVNLANEVLQLEPKLEEKDIDVSHRLPKPRSAREEDPRPVIVRFMTRKDRRRDITERSKLKKYNKDNGTHIYINEDLATYRAGLFRTVRKLLAQKHFNTAWTFNGNIKVTTRTNVVKSITTVDDIKALLPDVDIGNLN